MSLCPPGHTRNFLFLVRCIVCSFVFHVVVVFAGTIFLRFAWKSHRSFTVLGVHSREHVRAFYKELPAPRTYGTLKPKPQDTQLPMSPEKKAEEKNIVAPKPEVKSVPEKQSPNKKEATKSPDKKASQKKGDALQKPAAKPKAPSPAKSVVAKAQTEPPVAAVAEPVSAAAEVPDAIKEAISVHVANRTHLVFIQQEVARLWRPPVGVPQGTTCRVSFSVDKKGVVEKAAFVSRSAYVIYDLSIMQVAKQFSFNQACGARCLSLILPSDR